MQRSLPFTAEGAITKNRIVKWGSSNTQVIQASGVTDRLAGVYIGPADALNGDAIEVCMFGECFLEVSGAIGRGMTLTTDANGKGVNANPAAGVNNRTIAMAEQSGTDNTILVTVERGWIQGA